MVKDTGEKTRPGAIRPLNTPAHVLVKAGVNGCPRSISGMRVAYIEDRWRIDDEWWRKRPLSRVYYECILSDGNRATVFKDLFSGKWYRQWV